MLAGQRQREMTGALREPQSAPPQPPEARAPAVDADRAVRDPGRQAAAYEHASKRHVNPGCRVLAEIDPVQPDPARGVLATPVVTNHAAPTVQSQGAPGQLDRAVEAGGRHGTGELGPRQRTSVEQALLEVPEFGRVGADVQLPANRALLHGPLGKRGSKV